MQAPLVRSYHYWILIVITWNVGCLDDCSAFVLRNLPTTTSTTANNNNNINNKKLIASSSPTRISIQIAASTPSSSTTGTRKQNNNNNHEKWQPYYDALSEYKKHHGHCEVTMEENSSLCTWLEDQRKSYRQMKLGRKTKLTKKRAVALEMIGAIPTELMGTVTMSTTTAREDGAM